MNLLRDFRDNGLRQQPPAVELEEEQAYEIEAIVGNRLFRVQPQFMVSFISYNKYENMWIVEE